MEGYKSGGCGGGGVFVSWIEAWERLRAKEWDKKKKEKRADVVETRERKLGRLKDEEGYFCLISSKFIFSKKIFFPQ